MKKSLAVVIIAGALLTACGSPSPLVVASPTERAQLGPTVAGTAVRTAEATSGSTSTPAMIATPPSTRTPSHIATPSPTSTDTPRSYTDEEVSLEYTVTLDSPPDQASVVHVSLTLNDNAEPNVYFVFCWYQNKNYKSNITAASPPQVSAINAADSNGSDLPISLVDDPAVASRYGWEQSTLWMVEASGASSLTVSYSKEFQGHDSPNYALFLVPLNVPVERVRVSFHVPPGYRVIVPWKEEYENVFIVSGTGLRSWLGNLTFVDILCIPSNYPVTTRVVDGTSVEFYGPFDQDNVDYSCDVFRYLKQLHGGYEHGRFILYFGDPSAYIVSPWSYSGGTNQGFAEPSATYREPVDWLMGAYWLGHRKFGRYNCSGFHEWSHAWNVIVLRSSTSVGKWYHDAIANYYEAIGPRDLWGLEEIYEAQLYQAWDYYRSHLGSSIDKPLHQLNPFEGGTYSNETALMIYSKGMLFYYMLDKEFQLRGKEFSDFVKVVYATFNSEHPGTVHDFVDLANGFADQDLSTFMDNYLLGNAQYPLAELDAFKASYDAVFGNGDWSTLQLSGMFSVSPHAPYSDHPAMTPKSCT